ncbi:hypothetical protein RYX36_016153 [Vicia faba]
MDQEKEKMKIGILDERRRPIRSKLDENKILRTAYFFKPSIQYSHFLPPCFSISSKITTKPPLEIRYNG